VRTAALAPAVIALIVVGGSAMAVGGRVDGPPDSGVTVTTVAGPHWDPEQRDPLVKQRTKGDPDAPLVIYEMSDFQCPACKAFVHDILPDLEREYVTNGKVQMVFVNLPLVQIHANAPAAHEFAMCAAQQDLFWPVHDLLFRYQESWAHTQEPVGFFMMMADSAGLDKEKLLTCVESGELRWIVQQEATAVVKQGIRSTPSFIIEQLMIPGYLQMDGWRPLLDSLYTVKTKEN